MDEPFINLIRDVPRPSDPAAAARGLESLLAAVGNSPDLADRTQNLTKDPAGKAVLEAVFGNSPYLSHLIIRNSHFFLSLLDRPPEAALAEVIADLSAKPAEGAGTRAETMQRLRIAKGRSSLTIALADIGHVWRLDEVTRALSAVADRCIGEAIDALLYEFATRGEIDLVDSRVPGTGCGYVTLAMGKLGAHELNFSSDIDLIPLFDPDVVRYRGKKSPQDAFVRLTQGLVQILQERTGDGYVYRTDLRLRPDAGATPVAMSVHAAETYYESVGQNWERAAMIKARPVGGDPETGKAFLETIRPFVWRKHLDYAAIADIHSIKRQIDSNRGYTKLRVPGHNIKIGHGGIREIEFFAQTQQLIAGGRDPALRHSDTCRALRALEETHRIERAVADELVAAYGFLRSLEHRLQMIADEQTQTLPDDSDALAHLATFMGFPARAAFEETLLGHMKRVREHYGALFEDAPSLGAETGNLVFTGTEDDPDTLETLTGMGYREAKTVSAIFRRWHHGRYRAMRSTRAREMLTTLAPRLLSAFAATANPDAALLRFDEFLEKLPAGIQLFSLFYNNPSLLDLMAEIVGSAPRLAEFLGRDPLVLDSVLSEGFLDPLPPYADLAAEAAEHVGRARDYQDALDLARRWTRDRRLQTGVQVLRNLMPGHRAGPVLSDVADAVLNALIPVVVDDFARRHGSVPGADLGVVAMGKLGSREMMFSSDLDLIFIYENGGSAHQSDGDKPLPVSQYFARLGQQIISSISSMTPEGRLYEIDMRLRPSGAAGPIAVHIDGFEKYQREEAWTWERMALTRARVIRAPDALATKLDALVDSLLAERRDRDKLVRDVADMRRRVAEEHKASHPLQIKYVRGGLIDVEFIAQYFQLAHGPAHRGILRLPTAQVFREMGKANLVDQQTGAALSEATRLFQDVDALLRLCLNDTPADDDLPAGLARALARAAGLPDLATLKAELAERQAQVVVDYDEFVGRPGGVPVKTAG